MLVDEEVQEELQAQRVASLRRGVLLSDEELMNQMTGEDDMEDDYAEGDDGESDAPPVQEIRWGLLPEGLEVAPKPTQLDASLVRQLIYMRWERHGWLLGKITHMFDSSTPRLYAKYNYRIEWMDGWENHKLLLDNYASGREAPYSSWVLLHKSASTVEEAINVAEA